MGHNESRERPTMPRPKYQVFISSTFQDLKAEREQVVRACWEMGDIPVGMEMFNAADEEQWQIITNQIDVSDYYVVIVAHRYGSATDDGISYTEKEYDYAVSMKIPILGFVIDTSVRWPPDWVDSDDQTKAKLESFKQKVRKKPVSFWSSPEDLKTKFVISFVKQIEAKPRPGWVRADNVAGPQVGDEITLRGRENAGGMEL